MANESGLSFLKRGATLRSRKKKEQYGPGSEELLKDRAGKAKAAQAKAPLGPWMIYCYIVTALLPGFVLKACGEPL
jgi:chitin synthase